MKLVKNEEDLLPKLWKPSATAETPNGTSGSLPRPRKPPSAHLEAFRDRGNPQRHFGEAFRDRGNPQRHIYKTLAWGY